MANSLFSFATQITYNTAGAGNSFLPISGGITFSATEAEVETPIRDAGTFSNLFTYVSANASNVTVNMTLRKSVSDTTVTVAYTAAQTGIKEDTSNSASFANTDEATLKKSNSAGSGNITFRQFAIQFTPDTSSNSISVLGATSALAQGNGTKYSLPGGGTLNDATATEANVKLRVRGTFTASNLYTYVNSNASNGTTTIKTRKNGADGGQSVAYTTGQTGQKEDTSNTDSLVAGNDYNYSITNAGIGNCQFTALFSRLLSTAGQFVFLVGQAQAQSFNTTLYYYASGRMESTGAEADAVIYPRFQFTAKELGAFVSANTIATSATTITVRDNLADSSITVSFAAAETGLKNDSVNTATISIQDDIGYKVVTPNTSGSLTLQWMSVLGEVATAGGSAGNDWPTFMSRGFMNPRFSG